VTPINGEGGIMQIQWSRFRIEEWLVGLSWTAAVYCMGTLLQRSLRRYRFLWAIAFPLNLLLLVLAALFFLTPQLAALHR
jgi:hypothetical protein